MTWPISLEKVSSDSRQPPESVLEFLSCLLQNKDHPNREVVNHLIQSYAADLVHGVSCGRFITSKHFLLGLGLHNITGQKKPVQIVSHLGHSIDYNLVCEIETAQAEASQLLSTISGTLHVKPRASNDTVLTFFWVDNFDWNIEAQTGHGAINSTDMIAFQEEEAVTVQEELSLQFERKKSRTLRTPPTLSSEISVDPKKEPPSFSSQGVTRRQFCTASFTADYLLWIIIRKLNERDQIVSSYSGWLTIMRKHCLQTDLRKTALTYLPPINAKVTDFGTIYQYLVYLQQLACEANMPYVNVTLDVGAAITAYKVILNFTDHFKDVVIHCGDFHFVKENFAVIGKIISNTGFEDTVFQGGVCSTGSLTRVLAGSHYNRAWTVHSVCSEALECLLLERFLSDFESKVALPPVCFEAA